MQTSEHFNAKVELFSSMHMKKHFFGENTTHYQKTQQLAADLQ